MLETQMLYNAMIGDSMSERTVDDQVTLDCLCSADWGIDVVAIATLTIARGMIDHEDQCNESDEQ